MADALERITNLLVLLLETKIPLTLNAIANELGGQYPEGEAARRAAFERDKALLRAEGIPLEQQVMSGGDAGQTGYWIERSRFELADLGLTDAERAALALAVAAVRTDTEAGEDAIDKLGALGVPPAPPIELRATLATLDGLPVLFDAASRRARVTFDYHRLKRTVDPYALVARNGFWYLVGHDHTRDALRTFRVDRIESAIDVGEPNAFQRPDDFDARAVLPSEQLTIGNDDGGRREHALVLIDRGIAARVERELGVGAVVERRADGSIVVDVLCDNRIAFRSWLFGFTEQAEVLTPPHVRAEVVGWLAAIAEERTTP